MSMRVVVGAVLPRGEFKTGNLRRGIVLDGLCGVCQTPSSVLTALKAPTAISRSCRVWAADTCVLIRALPCGTTGYEKPTTYIRFSSIDWAILPARTASP